MTLDELVPYFDSISEGETDKLNELYKLFIDNFYKDELYYNDCRIVLKNIPSKLRGFKLYCESFVHIITRKCELKGCREFVPERANRVHWIPVILENLADPRIKFFKHTESNLVVRDYFWFRDKSYMVIIEKITDEYLMITGFIVEEKEEKRFERMLSHYLHSLK